MRASRSSPRTSTSSSSTLPLSPEPNARLAERYLTLVWESGARPVMVLTKADLAPDPEAAISALGDLGDVPVHPISARADPDLDRVRAYLSPGVTGALVGPSGAGKSTIVNALAGEERLETGARLAGRIGSSHDDAA